MSSTERIIGTTRRKLQFGTAGQLKAGAPEFSRRHVGSRVTITQNLMEPYEINFQATEDVVSIPLGVIEGVRAYSSDRRTRLKTRPGDLIFHPAGATVYVDAPCRVAEFFTFAVDPSLARDIVAELGSAGDVRDHSRSFHLRGLEAAVRVAQLARLLTRVDMGGTGKLAVDSLGILAFTTSLLPSGTAEEPRRSGLHAVRLGRVLDYVDAHCHRDIGLADLAEVAGLPLFHFARSFKRATGLTPHKYLLERRVALARQMLTTTDESVAAIAVEAGFASQSHMTDTFRRVLGTTPGRYRRSV